MSVRKLTFGLLAVAALLCGQRSSKAQEYLPVADPFRFDPNFRWFEPVFEQDLADMKPSKRANTGWFGSFDRMQLFFNRPDVDILREGNSTDYEDGFDSGWGNRLELGYMLDNGNGWSSTWMNISGPNAFESVLVERLDRFNQTDFDGPAADGDGEPFDGFGRFYPSADRNTPYFNERLYEVKDSINVMDASSFEINKTWRFEPYHYGGILEPLIGVRYFGVTDHWQNETYTRDIVNFTETLLSQRARTKNNMFGGQIGARYFKYRNRLRFSGEFRAMAMTNWQHHKSYTDQYFTTYDGVGVGSGITSEVLTRNGLTFRDNDEFVVGYDVRADLSYQLTSMFAIRGGIQVIDLRGIWRGQITDGNDQTLIMAGATFGVELNR